MKARNITTPEGDHLVCRDGSHVRVLRVGVPPPLNSKGSPMNTVFEGRFPTVRQAKAFMDRPSF